MAAPLAAVSLVVTWDRAYYDGSGPWTAWTFPTTCTASSYVLPDMGAWNDRTSSAAANATNGCVEADFYEFTYLGGSYYWPCTTSCLTMGWIDNKSKSFRVY